MLKNIIVFLAIALLISGCKEEIKKDNNLTKKLVKEKKSKVEEKKKEEQNITTTTDIAIVEEEEEVVPEETNITTEYDNEQLELKTELESYLDQLKSLNIEGIIDMTYPKLFIPINKNMFKRYINSIITSKDIAIDSFDTNITNIGDIQSFSNGEFATIEYKSIIKLSFLNPKLYSDKLSMRVLNDALSSKYGSDNIKIDSRNREIVIKKDERLLAIKEKDSSWKFIGDNREYRRLYPQIIPLDILSQI